MRLSADGNPAVLSAVSLLMTTRAVRMQIRHEGWVSSAAFSADGTRVVTASRDTTARVWDARTGETLGSPMRHESWVRSATFSGNGTHVLTVTVDNKARVWSARTGEVMGPPLRHEGWVSSATFSADGTRVVTASGDNTARVWDVFPGLPFDAERLASLSEAFGGFTVNEGGALVPLGERRERLAALQRQSDQPLARERLSPVELLTRWLFADPWTRTMSPLSLMTVPQYICDCLRHDAYAEAQRIFAGHPLLAGGPSGPLPSQCVARP
jgi:hypothetical protein